MRASGLPFTSLTSQSDVKDVKGLASDFGAIAMRTLPSPPIGLALFLCATGFRPGQSSTFAQTAPVLRPRRKNATGLLTLLVCAFTRVGVAEDAESERVREALALVRSPERMIEESRFEVTELTDTAISGVLDLLYNGQRVTFTSSMATPTMVRLRLELGDVVLEADAHLEGNTRTLDGHGHALSLDQRLALTALALQLHLRLQPYQNALPEHEDLLFRVVNYYAEAPVGWQLRRLELTPPPPGPLPLSEPLDDTEVLGASSGQCGGDFAEDLSTCPSSGCVNDEDGITLLSNPCCCRDHTLCHDAHSFPFICGSGSTPGQPHRFCCETVRSGCDIPSGCLGRCGLGCTGGINTPGEGVYTIDCGDHDRCCRVHDTNCLTPASVACGDEYEDAADDFVYANAPFNDVCTEGCYECCSNSDCNDNNVCTTDSCVNGICQLANNSNTCNDNSACTTNDRCSNGSCNGTSITCNDNNPCTNDSCSPSSGCVYTNNTSSCNDNNACTSNDRCSNGSCSGTAITCNDNNVCTNDSCNPSSGCVYTNNANPCDDGNACNSFDQCCNGSCCGTTDVITCNDNNVCTNDSCNPSSGCVYANNSNPCNDGLYCNGTDTCSGGSCTQHAGDPCAASGRCCIESNDSCATCPCPDDGNPCTDEVVVNGQCTHPNNSKPCNDGLYCNGTDTCGAGSCSVHSDNPCPPPKTCNEALDRCDDAACPDEGNSCTDEVLVNGQCTHPNKSNGIPCDDNNANTNNDRCSNGVCIGDPGPCSDGDCASDTDCDDGNYCNGTETCVGCQCQVGARPCNAVTEECDEDEDRCVADSQPPAPTPPNPPTNLVATNGTFAGYVRITWSGPSGDEYRVYRCRDAGLTNCIPASPWVTDEHFDDDGGEVGVTFWYRVRASNEAGESGFSNASQGHSACLHDGWCARGNCINGRCDVCQSDDACDDNEVCDEGSCALRDPPPGQPPPSPCGAFGILGVFLLIGSGVSLKLVRCRRHSRTPRSRA